MLTGLPAVPWIKEMSSVQHNDWLSIHHIKLGCIPCRKVGNLGVEAKMGMKLSKEWATNQITYFGTNRKQQLMSLQKKIILS